MSKINQNFDIMSGDSVAINVQVKNPAGVIIDLDFFTEIYWRVYDRGVVIIEKKLSNAGIIIVDHALGIFLISMLSEDTENIEGCFRHEARCVDSSGNEISVLIGDMNVTKSADEVYTLRDLLGECIEHAGMPISDSDFLKHYNSVLRELSAMYNTAKLYKDIKFIVTDPTEYFPLDVRLLRIERALNMHGENYPHFVVRSRQIKFAEMGAYTLQGLYNPRRIDNMKDGIEINPAYIPCISKYIASRALMKSDKEYSQQLYQEYITLARIINDNLRKTINPYRRVKAPRWR
jgi:hypothetical protein